jgi:hypothetical protein
VAAISAERPLIVFFDDVQWADAATLELLVHVAGRSHDAAMLILGACRVGEAADNTALVSAKAELARRRQLCEIQLEPLDAEDTAALARHLLGGPVAAQSSAAIYRQSEGNALFVEELLRALVEQGHFAQCGAEWRLDTSREQPLSCAGSWTTSRPFTSRRVWLSIRQAPTRSYMPGSGATRRSLGCCVRSVTTSNQAVTLCWNRSRLASPADVARLA